MKDFKKYFFLPASPEDIYNVLTNQIMIEIWTGEKAIYSTEPNTEFSMWDGAICGVNLEFEDNKKIVQKWFFGEDENNESLVTIKLHPDKDGTSIEVRQLNIPDEAYDNIAEGWEEDYIGALAQLFE